MEPQGMSPPQARQRYGILHQIESGLGDAPAASNESQPQLSRAVCPEAEDLRFISNRDARHNQRTVHSGGEELCAERRHHSESCRSRHDMRIGLTTTQLACVVVPPAPNCSVSPE